MTIAIPQPANLSRSLRLVLDRGLALSVLLTPVATFAQNTAAPTVLPPKPNVQSTTDRMGVDLTSGSLADFRYPALSIGDSGSGLSASYFGGGVLDATAYLELERFTLYSGGFILARVSARGSVHTFVLGTISQTTVYVPPPAQGHIAWTFSPYGSGADSFIDVNNDGAILYCSGTATSMYQDGTCSLYLAQDGSRVDFHMPNVPYSTNILNRWDSWSTLDHVAYAWPTTVTEADGEVLSYRYRNYADYDLQSGNTPAATAWNAIESSLGYRIYLSNAAPTATSNPGAMQPAPAVPGVGSMSAINTSREYADPLTTSRSFGTQSLSSTISSTSSGGVTTTTLKNNGVLIDYTKLSSTGILVVRPDGGSRQYDGIIRLPPYSTSNATQCESNPFGRSTPSGAFPFLNFTAKDAATTSYSVAITAPACIGETYTVTVTNPDSSQSSFKVQYGLLLSSKDELQRETSYTWLGAEGYVYGIPGFSTIARLSSVSLPNGSTASYTYSHGAISKVVETPSDGSAARTTEVGLPTSCTLANYRVCNKPTYIKDARGNQIDYTYDPAHGGILTETFPANAAGVRPQKRYSYMQLYPKTLNSSGQLVDSSAAWRLTRSSECSVATASNPASCVGTANEHVIVYAYADPNLRLTSKTDSLGDGSQVRTVTYTYDYAGNLVSEKGPRTDVNDTRYTTYDVLRRKVFEISADPDGSGALTRVIVHHVYDADGNEVRTEYGSGAATDGSDFVVSRFDRMTYDNVTGALLKKELVVP